MSPHWDIIHTATGRVAGRATRYDVAQHFASYMNGYHIQACDLSTRECEARSKQ